MSIAPLLAATQNASMFDPVSPPAEVDPQLIAILALAVTGFISVIVEGAPSCLVRFPARPAAPSPHPSPPGGEGWGEAMEPPQVYGSKPIEIAWTVGPLLIVFGSRAGHVTRHCGTSTWTPPKPPVGGQLVLSSRWSAGGGGGSTPTTITTAGNTASPLPTSCTCPARRGKRPGVWLTLKSADVCRSFLGAALAAQDRSDSGRFQPYVVSDVRTRPVRRPMRGILRRPARQHAPPGDRRSARRV